MVRTTKGTGKKMGAKRFRGELRGANCGLNFGDDCRKFVLVEALTCSLAAVCFALGTLPGPASEPPRKLDPAAWGSDPVDKAVPESITGDECLFCHRVQIGPAWP